MGGKGGKDPHAQGIIGIIAHMSSANAKSITTVRVERKPYERRLTSPSPNLKTPDLLLNVIQNLCGVSFEL